MKKILFPLFLLLISFNSWAQSKFAAKHQKAIIYLQGASLTAQAQATLNSGKNTIVITGLSGGIQSESIRIKGDGIKINNFSHQLNYLEADNRNKNLLKLQEELELIDNSISKISQQSTILNQEKDMILSNKTVAGTENGMDPTKLSQLADFYRTRLNDILNKQLALDKESKSLNENRSKLVKQIQATSNQIITPSGEIEIQLESSKTGTIPIQIEYFINEAGWIPTYDLRVNSLNTSFNLDYLASIYQNSGFDWKGMEVVVSSSDPSNSITGINLKPWFVNTNSYKLDYDLIGNNTQSTLSGYILSSTSEAIPYANIKVVNSSLGTSADQNGKFSLRLTPESKLIRITANGYETLETSAKGGNRNFYLQSSIVAEKLEKVSGVQDQEVTTLRGSRGEQQIIVDGIKTRNNFNLAAPPPLASPELKESNAENNSTAVNVEYTLKEKVDIKSDGKPLNFLIQKMEVPGTYNSVVYPKINSNAFLNIYLLEWEKLNLLEGEVNMFFGNSFIGKSSLNLNQVSDSLRFDFGKDPNIKTIRTLLNAKTSNQALSANKQSVYRWETEVRNIANFETKVKIIEPFPISQNKEIKIDLDKDLSGANVNTEKGLLTWEITLKPGESRKLSYGFSITYPKSMQIRIE